MAQAKFEYKDNYRLNYSTLQPEIDGRTYYFPGGTRSICRVDLEPQFWITTTCSSYMAAEAEIYVAAMQAAVAWLREREAERAQ